MSNAENNIEKSNCSNTSTVLITAEWERDDENTPVITVLSAVAEIEDSDPVDLPPLYDAINPEALNDLFISRPEPSVNQITFQYAGYAIEARGSGKVHVRSA